MNRFCLGLAGALALWGAAMPLEASAARSAKRPQAVPKVGTKAAVKKPLPAAKRPRVKPTANKVADALLPVLPPLQWAVLHLFEARDGSRVGSLRREGDWIYGAGRFGGVNFSGTLWKVRADGSDFQVFYSFSRKQTQHGNGGDTRNVDGAAPMVFEIGGDGFLYGITDEAGPQGQGTVWRVKTDGQGFQVLHAFTPIDAQRHNEDGDMPLSSLAFLPDGSLLGGCMQGGPNGRGVLWKLGRDGTGFTVLQIFDAPSVKGGTEENPFYANAQGYYPTSLGLADNRILGTARGGGQGGSGVIWSCALDGSDWRVLHSFEPAYFPHKPNRDGLDAASVMAFQNALWGASFGGGTLDGFSSGAGTLWKMAVDGSAFHLLRSFPNDSRDPHYRDGSQPFGSLFASPGEWIYGVTRQGGQSGEYVGNGTCFRFRSDGSNFQVVYAFDTQPDDAKERPVQLLPPTRDGVLYGTYITDESKPTRTETLLVCTTPLP